MAPSSVRREECSLPYLPSIITSSTNNDIKLNYKIENANIHHAYHRHQHHLLEFPPCNIETNPQKLFPLANGIALFHSFSPLEKKNV